MVTVSAKGHILHSIWNKLYLVTYIAINNSFVKFLNTIYYEPNV